jgi:hypothetical protein
VIRFIPWLKEKPSYFKWLLLPGGGGHPAKIKDAL